MKVHCILNRDGGTQVTLGETEYDFQPDDNGCQVAEVTDKAHIERFLSIPEGYTELGKKPKKAVVVVSAKPVIDGQTDDDEDDFLLPEPLLGSDWEPAINEYAVGKSILTEELVKRAFDDSALSVADWNAQTKEEVESLLEVQLEIVKKQATPIVNANVPPVPHKDAQKNLSKAEKKAALAARKAELGQN